MNSMKKNLFVLVLVFASQYLFTQQNIEIKTEKILRINFINPAIELEIPTGQYSTFSASVGIGYGGGYPNLSYENNDYFAGSGFIYIISPFIDLQEKFFYNFYKRNQNGKNIKNNSANFISIRVISRGKSIAENISRSSNFDIAIGPTWGIQRKYGKNFHLLFDVGPQYYFDLKGNGNIWPLMMQLNIGFDLKKK